MMINNIHSCMKLRRRMDIRNDRPIFKFQLEQLQIFVLEKIFPGLNGNRTRDLCDAGADALTTEI